MASLMCGAFLCGLRAFHCIMRTVADSMGRDLTGRAPFSSAGEKRRKRIAAASRGLQATPRNKL